jgi:diguanylate cyclase (GGDEF)-like protein
MARSGIIAVEQRPTENRASDATVSTQQKRPHRQDMSEVRLQTHADPARRRARGESAPLLADLFKVPQLTALARARTARDAQRLAAELHASLGARASDFEPLIAALVGRAREFEQLQRLAGRDELTGVANRRTFNDALRRELARTRRDGRPLALLLFDLDGLKAINDELGHPAGDEVLRTVARCASRALRDGDLLARLGGDEFGVVLPTTTERQALAAGQRIRALLSGRRVAGAAVRLSFGVAIASGAESDEGSLLLAADADLYRDKLARRSVRPGG